MIRVTLIYKTDTASLVGAFAVLDRPAFTDPNATVQTFPQTGVGGQLTMMINHFKSKGSGCGTGDDDTSTGQGNCNGTRILAAQALADWLATGPTE